MKEAIIACLKYMRFIKKITNQEYADLTKWLDNNLVYNLEIPAEDVTPKEDGSFNEDKFLERELSAFLQNYDKEYDDDAAVSDVARHFYEIGKKQKEQKELPLMNGDADLYFDNWIQHNDTTKRGCFEEGMRYTQRLQKEQKSVVTHGETYHVDTLGTQQVIAGKMPQKPYEPKNWPADKDNMTQEQKPADDKAFEEWIDDWWKHNKVNNPDSYNKGDEIQFDEQGFKNFCRGIRNMYAEQKPAEWSEEDEVYLQDALWCVKQAAKVAKDENDMGACWSAENWLKSLRPSWKPSEEQMEQNHIRKDAIVELLQGMIQSCKTKNGFPADTLAAMRIDTIETVISRIEEICKEERK